MGQVRSAVWGPAEFVGLPPWWLTGEGLLAGVLAVGAIVGTTVAGAWYGIAGPARGEAGLVCAAALAVYLCAVRAGRALIGIVAVLGVCLALHAPQVAAGVVLAERGRVESVVVTAVQDATAATGPGRYLCSVADRHGVPLDVRIWRGCEQTTRPGDALAVVYDPMGSVSPQGVEAGVPWARPVRDLVGWAVALLAASVIAVVRSYRLPPVPLDTWDAPGPATGGGG
ncbi:hypothetical protein ACK389_00220 [Streptomyces antibioticus]|uniref:DUF3592 domain-containing protein n=1 Tax=Streptomyces antibioticus TaxID=1890 RepID=A0AAE6YFA6_STRAT|nr:hypothetical protein [Streptomyces antibioticus]MCX4740933.1 hypothetical protein [Streptomyces antibioticus]QIT48566.1 hypothetical protein HCX60_37795 [Streptomyces antibioticus]